MNRYRLVRSEKRTIWSGSGGSIHLENPTTLEEGTLAEVIEAAVEEVRDTLEYEVESGDLPRADLPRPDSLRRYLGREIVRMAGGDTYPLPLDSEGFWCLTVEEVESN